MGQTLELRIDGLSFHGGRGVGRCDGVVVFVSWTAPGDLVQVRVTEVKKSFLVAELIALVEPSPHRRSPRCPVFGRCGGCTWQHVDYAVQLEQKQKILESSLRLLRRDHDFPLKPIQASPTEYEYRNRLQLQKWGEQAGFYARGSRDLVPTDNCPIGERAVSEKISELRSRPDGRYEISRRTDGQIEIEAGQRRPETALFTQVNSAQNQVLINSLLAAVQSFAVEEIWDLYCGSGNLTNPLSQAFPAARVRGVELSQDAIEQARRAHGKIDWHAADVAHYLRQRSPAGKLLVVLDPPRDGLADRVVQELGRIRPAHIAYVSCDPMTFARDAAKLSRLGFEVLFAQGFDMFPQTEHVELLSVLRSVISS